MFHVKHLIYYLVSIATFFISLSYSSLISVVSKVIIEFIGNYSLYGKYLSSSSTLCGFLF